jgi:hypothetical protein
MAPIYERLVGTLRESPGEEETSEFFKDLTTKMMALWAYADHQGMDQVSSSWPAF